MAFVIGASGPKAPSNFARMVTILKNIVDEYEVSSSKTRLALVDYNSAPANARVFFSDGYSKEKFKAVAENIPGPGSRPGTLSDALKKVRDEVFTFQRGERPLAQDILVVMTEGDFDENSTDIRYEVLRLRDKPVKIIVIAITNEPDEDKLKGVASGDNLVVAPKPGEETEEAKKVPFIAAQGWFIVLFPREIKIQLPHTMTQSLLSTELMMSLFSACCASYLLQKLTQHAVSNLSDVVAFCQTRATSLPPPPHSKKV